MKIAGLTFTYNEAEIVKFVMDYWMALGVDKLVVYDNQSTDSTRELLSNYSFVELHTYETDGEFDEFYLTNLRNMLWKGLVEYDYVIVTDFDEVPFYEGKGDFKSWISYMESTVIRTAQVNIIRDTFPTYTKGVLLHTMQGNKFNREGIRFDKVHTFSPLYIEDINYDLGCHYVHPRGKIIYTEYPKNFYFFHLRYLSKEYVLRKSQGRYDRLSDYIKTTQINHHYKDTLNDYEKEINKLGKIYENLEDAL